MGKRKQWNDFQAIAAVRGGECIHPSLPVSREKVRWRCANGHEFDMRTDNVLAGGWCTTCSGRRRWTTELIAQALEDSGIRCLSSSNELKSNKTRLHWSCEAGHKWRTALVNVVYRQSGCPHCMNKAESWAREVFEDFFDAEFPKCRPPWLKGLELDGYAEKHGRAFEYQGRQHFEPIDYFQVDDEKLAAIQARDARKLALCRENFVFLYAIRHHPRDCFRKDSLQAYVESELVAQLLLEQEELRRGEHWLQQAWTEIVAAGSFSNNRGNDSAFW